jgi:glycosyltransferase involved in cell wall biosynthesis
MFDLAQHLILNHTPKIEPIITSEPRPFWSVMIPTYHCANYLVETLKSVLAQDPGPEQMQIEVVDDCSTEDDPEAVVREIGQGRVSFYRQPQNGGIANNFNTCIHRAKGEWVHILHGDDAVLPGFYSRLRESIEKERNLGAVLTRCIFIDENNMWKQFSALYKEKAGIIPNFWQSLAITNTVFTPSIVVKRNVYEQLGGFHTQLSHTADWEMWKRISVYYPIWFEPQPLALYREHSKSDTSRLMQTGSNITQTLKAINISELYLPKEYSTNLSNQAKEVTARSGLNTAYRMLLERGDIYGAVNQIRESIKCSISPVVLNSFASLLTQSEILLQLVANMFISTNDETLFSNIVTEINNSEFNQNIALNLKDINVVIFPDWQIQEELLYNTLILVIKKIFSLPNCENINLLIYNNQINDEDANFIISDVVFHIYQENDVDITEEPGISIISNYSESQWRILLKKINAHIIMEYENYQAIQNLPPNTIPSFNLNELENKNIFI